jgi:cytidine deaminase
VSSGADSPPAAAPGASAAPGSDLALLQAARDARSRAHAPYSQFAVGAAVRGASGRVYVGANVECSSYGLTLCAERLAVCAAVLEGEARIDAVAVVADTEGPPGPCGACRQFLFDFARAATVHMENLKGDRRDASVEALVPWGFGPQDLVSFAARRP